MNEMNVEEVVSVLESAGWSCARSEKRLVVPEQIAKRYPWVPSSFFSMAGAFEHITSQDGKVWFLTLADYSGESDSSYSWNEWEQLSLEETGGDQEWASEISQFWDEHFPICLSVRDGYQYLAIEKGSLNIVRGCSPEFEDVETVGGSIVQAFDLDLLKSM